ncbi:MAG: outer membrane beta-barrel protein [Bacteroidales bacterium]|nr:outer membrane beta-barrel protein [Bacteroidales bacterium]MCF8391724.1 outer membrane beta-barrel protein [Bacteroidales bacterium]
MKTILLITALFFIPILASAQFDQKMSLNFSVGGFETIGKKYGEIDVYQMPNYKIGPAFNLGIQFQLNNRLSLLAEAGFMFSHSWNYSDQNGDWIYWTIEDSISGEEIENGENYLEISNYSFSLKPLYYLNPDSKFSPYLFAGISFNYTTAYYEDTYWNALNEMNLLAQDDTEPYIPFLEKNTGLGVNPGFGLEYSPGKQFHFYFSSSYYFMPLQSKNFKYPEAKENFHALVFQFGTRYNFIKTKDL